MIHLYHCQSHHNYKPRMAIIIYIKRSSGTILGYIGIVGYGGIGNVPVALVDSKLTWML